MWRLGAYLFTFRCQAKLLAQMIWQQGFLPFRYIYISEWSIKYLYFDALGHWSESRDSAGPVEDPESYGGGGRSRRKLGAKVVCCFYLINIKVIHNSLLIIPRMTLFCFVHQVWNVPPGPCPRSDHCQHILSQWSNWSQRYNKGSYELSLG